MVRARDLGISFEGRTGPYNAITDVAGVEVATGTPCDGSIDPRTKDFCEVIRCRNGQRFTIF